MKKNQLNLFAGIIFSLYTSLSLAQTVNVSQPEIALDAPAKSASKADQKALKNFDRQFKSKANVKWHIGIETITASTIRDGKQVTVVYDKKGRWLRNMYSYDESKLPRDVRHTVKSVYYDFAITTVQEIREGMDTFYVIHLEDKTDYKQVCVYEGEIHMIREFQKQQ
jgi:hypothetical protein